jgi:hypothetical protein
LALDNGEGILLGTIHPYHPALMYSNESNGNPTQPNPWYGIPFGNQKLGILFRYTESISGQQTVFESLILPSQNSVGFIGSTDETPWGQIFQQESNISIVLVPEPKSVFLLIIGFAFLLSFRRIIPLGNIFQKKARNS